MPRSGSPGPLYKKVKRYVLDRIHGGQWRPGDRVLSENALVKELGVSRMTVNRALRELTDEGYLERIAGVGTFVAQSRLQGHPLEVLNIADEIKSRGNTHRARLICALEEPWPRIVPCPWVWHRERPVFHSQIVHYENDQAIQLEDRYVNPVAAPDYLSVDFERTTPSEYLLEVAPLKKVEHTVRAVMPNDEVRRLLDMPGTSPVCCWYAERGHPPMVPHPWWRPPPASTTQPRVSSSARRSPCRHLDAPQTCMILYRQG